MASSARQTKGTARTASTARTGTTARKRRFFNYPRSHVKSFRRWLPSWRVLLGTFLTGVALVAGIVIAAYATTTVPEEAAYAKQQKTTVYYADGVTEIGTFQVENRVIVPFDSLPEYVGNAVVASEDATFWENSGVDIKGMARAALNNVTGGPRQGASTITQQYAERYYSDETISSYAGKFREAMLALRLTQKEDKKEILGNYLNTIYFGRGAHGIEAAAQAYFGVPAANLTLSQAALISAVIPSPNNYDPAVNPETAEAKWNRVIRRMGEQGLITPEEKAAAAFPVDTLLPKATATNTKGGQAGYLLDMVQDEWANSGRDAEDLFTKGYTIVTTIDKAMQDLAVATAEGTIPRDGEHPANAGLSPSIVSIDSADGAVKAIYGGPDFVTKPFNSATDGIAQAGSTFKPFTLVAALEQGIDLSARYDGNNDVEVPGFYEKGKGVKNFDNGTFGEVDLVKATANSINSVYAALNMEVGPEATVEAAVKAGIPADTMDLKPVPSNVLGTASVHPIDLAHAYATFAAQGFESTPHVVQSVKLLSSGAEIWEPAGRNERVFEPDTMAAATYAMTQVVEAKGASGAPAKALKRPVAGKTGTSNDNKSAWFTGYIPQLATIVGLYQTNPETQAQEQIEPFGEYYRKSITGGTWPVDAWTQYMEGVIALPQYAEVQEFPQYTPKKPVPTETPSEVPTEIPPVDEPEEPEQPETQTAIPTDLVGRSKADARAALEALGFRVAFTEEYSADVAKDVVIRVGSAGQPAAPGTTVAVVVSKGQDPNNLPTNEVVVPEVTGQAQGAAEAVIRRANLVSTVREEESQLPKGQVIRVEPGAGQKVPPGSTVTLVVSKGPPQG
ncbi:MULTISPECIES: transglycosylase domain-containing protein [Oerskovia]|uniref:Transglycosylase domain-containing protein n=1 Tax=Oerskovia gallyi TaxID=2762226 RepID=A0ABR8V4G9_9CELL|nr:transglycosylase domain-containing protein [Oerskovia gallyi]MBD7999557.1 transglycosylase domain-containing protein [Oerskovia gallyi]